MLQEYDETLYPEKYRKKTGKSEENDWSAEPFDVCYVCEMFSEKSTIEKREDVFLRLKRYFRPLNTHLNKKEAESKDLNLLYWSDEGRIIRCANSFEEHPFLTFLKIAYRMYRQLQGSCG